MDGPQEGVLLLVMVVVLFFLYNSLGTVNRQESKVA